MILETVYKLGDMLGLEHNDINCIISDKSSLDITNNIKVPFSPLDGYKMEAGFYGNISINDFQ